MTPAQAAYQAARQARAIAEGYTSYSQKFRAESKAGFKAGGKAYNAALTARRTGRVQASKVGGRLLGLRQTRAGRVVAAQFNGDTGGQQASAQWAAIRGLSDRYHVAITIDGYFQGRALTLGGHGGYRLAFLRQLVGLHGSWAAAIAALAGEQYPEIEEAGDLDGVTVTAVVA